MIQSRESFRWRSEPEIDVDAFFCEQKKWFLFAYLKRAELAQSADYLERLSREFGEPVLCVGGALKTETGSKPLVPFFCEGGVLPEIWGKEGPLWLRLEAAEVLNPGVFLDQKENRVELVRKIKNHTESRGELLNLFSYTGAFSVAGLKAGAQATTSVDLSARYLDWERKNLEKNGFAGERSFRLIAEDARDFLKREVKRRRRYQWIVIDPPTFSRGKRVFKVQDELSELIELGARLLNPGGAMLASCNDARWEPSAFQKQMSALAHELRLKLSAGRVTPGFEQTHPLKSVWFEA